MPMGVLPARMSVTSCVPGAGRGQRSACISDPRELDLQMVVRPHCRCWELNAVETAELLKHLSSSFLGSFEEKAF